MRKLIKDAIDSEPLFKYSLWIIKWCFIIIFYVLYLTWNLFIFFIDILSYSSPDAEKQSKWLTDCAMQEQWQRNQA